MLFDFLMIIKECLLSPASQASLLNLQLKRPLMHYTLNPYGHLRGKVSGGKFHSSLFPAVGEKGEKNNKERKKTEKYSGKEKNTTGQH